MAWRPQIGTPATLVAELLGRAFRIANHLGATSKPHLFRRTQRNPSGPDRDFREVGERGGRKLERLEQRRHRPRGIL